MTNRSLKNFMYSYCTCSNRESFYVSTKDHEIYRSYANLILDSLSSLLIFKKKFLQIFILLFESFYFNEKYLVSLRDQTRYGYTYEKWCSNLFEFLMEKKL